MKKFLLLGLISGALATIMSLLFNEIYSRALLVDFSLVINFGSIAGSCFIGTLLPSLALYFFRLRFARVADPLLSILFLVFSFGALYGTFATTLPESLEAPELFPGLSAPMHFFPLLAWLLVKDWILPRAGHSTQA